MKHPTEIKEILLKQMQILQEACDQDLLPEEAARLSEALSSAVTVAVCVGPKERIRIQPLNRSC